MALTVSIWTGMLLAALAVAGCLYEVVAIALLLRFFGREPAPSAGAVGATLLKPLHGIEPRLQQNLASFLDQDYAGAVQMVCGVGDRSDAATAVAERLQRDHPDSDIVLVANSNRGYANGKIANLANMMTVARYDVLLLSDSDMAVSPDYLSTIV